MGILRFINKAKRIHGDGFEYRFRKGTRVLLSILKDNESVCAGNKKGHISMTKK